MSGEKTSENAELPEVKAEANAPQDTATQKTEEKPKRTKRVASTLPKDMPTGNEKPSEKVDVAKEENDASRVFSALEKRQKRALEQARKHGPTAHRWIFQKITQNRIVDAAEKSGDPYFVQAAKELPYDGSADTDRVLVLAFEGDEPVELTCGEAVVFYAWLAGAKTIQGAMQWMLEHPVMVASLGLGSIMAFHFFNVKRHGELVVKRAEELRAADEASKASQEKPSEPA